MSRVNYPEFLEHPLKNGPKHSIIHVKNLSANARVGVDVWGRTEGGRHDKFQPVQISTSIALREPFATAANSDSVDGSTVHYGILSKEILKVLDFRTHPARAQDPSEPPNVVESINRDWTLVVLLDVICAWLTGQSFGITFLEELYDGEAYVHKELDNDPWANSSMMQESKICPRRAIVSMKAIQELELCCFLPKGSILGSGVSLRVLMKPLLQVRESPKKSSAVSVNRQIVEYPLTFCSILKIHDIRIPTLIGVNDNERLAKQMVIANVEIDGYFVWELDLYHKLEQIVVKTIEESSFETLETLGTHLINRITKWFIIAEYDSFKPKFEKRDRPTFEQLITVTLEKPSAVMFAASPMIEVRRHADPIVDVSGMSSILFHEMRVLSEGNGGDPSKIRVPFPLQGRLDAWIRAADPDDTT